VEGALAKVIAATRNSAAVDFAVMGLKLVREGVLGYADLGGAFEVVARVAQATQGADAVLALHAAARVSSKVRSAERSGAPDVGGLRDAGGPGKADPPGLQQTVAQLFEEWARRLMAR
jgi:hypothetical protein